MLVACDPGDRNFRPEKFGAGGSVDLAAASHFGEERAGDVENFQHPVTPIESLNVEEESPARVGDIGEVILSTGQIPNEPRIDRSEGQFASLGPVPDPGHMIQHPANLGA